MKVIVAIACLLAGAIALPSLRNQRKELETAIRSGDQRLVTGSIISAIEDAAQAIRDAGLDPLEVDRTGIDYALPVPSIFNAKTSLEDLLVSGLSNIVIHDVNYGVITSRLTFEIELPKILLSILNAEWDVKLFDRKLHGQLSGDIAVQSIKLSGRMTVSVGIITGVSIRNLAMEFSLRNIDSNLRLRVQGEDLSDRINHYLGDTIPGTLNDYKSDINQLITIYAQLVIDASL